MYITGWYVIQTSFTLFKRRNSKKIEFYALERNDNTAFHYTQTDNLYNIDKLKITKKN